MIFVFGVYGGYVKENYIVNNGKTYRMVVRNYAGMQIVSIARGGLEWFASSTPKPSHALSLSEKASIKVFDEILTVNGLDADTLVCASIGWPFQSACFLHGYRMDGVPVLHGAAFGKSWFVKHGTGVITLAFPTRILIGAFVFNCLFYYLMARIGTWVVIGRWPGFVPRAFRPRDARAE